MLRSFSTAVLIAAALLIQGCGKPSGTDGGTPGVCTGRLPGDLVISEFMPDPEGADEGKEYIEIFNASNRAIDLAGVTLQFSRADGSAQKKTNLTQGTIAAGDYYVVGDIRDGAPLPAHINDTYEDGLGALSNVDGKLEIKCGDATLDTVTYTITKSNSARTFDGVQLPDSNGNDDENRWCNSPVQTGDFFGSPRAANAPCVKVTCTGRNPGDLVITEFMANPTGADTGFEYIELFNPGGATINLEGMTLRYSQPDGTGVKNATLAAGTIAPGKYVTFGDSRVTPLPAHIDYSYGADLGAMGNTDGVITVLCGATVVDEIIYNTASKDGIARILDGNVPGGPDAVTNDDEGEWCDARIGFGTFTGSPRSANEACLVTTTCLDQVTNNPRTPVAPVAGQLIITEVMANPTGIDGDREWFELHALQPVDLNGVVVSRTSQTSTTKVTIASERCLSIPTGGYAVVAKRLPPDQNGGIASPVDTFPFSLLDGETLYVSHNTTLIDRATFPPIVATDGVSTELSADRLDAFTNDSPYAWCDGEITYGAGGKGTPGAANRTCFAPVGPGECRQGTILDGGVARAIIRPDGGSVVITEVMAAPNPPPGAAVDRPKEWFEITVTQPVDLNEVEVANELGSKDTITQAACFHVVPGQFLLFAQTLNANQNGGLPAPNFVFSSFDLANTGTTANPERSVIVRSQGFELDRLSWATTTVGASIQLSSAAPLTPAANDVGTNRCDTSINSPYGDAGTPDRGTPAAANEVCP